ncbi:MAG: 50S ribosomal protein L21e [Candidatus Woesearchaeota archaeon]
MTKRIGGPRRGTRSTLKKNIRNRGKFSIRSYLQEFHAGDRVVLAAEPAVHEGLYHRRHHGRMGTVQNKKGSCYEVMVKDLNKQKTLIVHPVHLKKL